MHAHSSGHESTARRSGPSLLRLSVFITCGLIAAGVGAVGLWEYERDVSPIKDPNLFKVVLKVALDTLQLFVLEPPHLEGKVPFMVLVGRGLAAALVLWAVAEAGCRIFRTEFGLLWLQVRRRLLGSAWGRPHVVICGLGRIGTQLALEFRGRRKRSHVVAITPNDSTEHAERAKDAGVIVVVGDASSAATLGRAGVTQADQVIAVCEDEQKNVAVAAAVGRLLDPASSTELPGDGRVRDERPRHRRPLDCWLLIADARVRQLFRQSDLFPHTSGLYRVSVRGLDFFELAARRVSRMVPLDFERIGPDDATVMRLVIVGFGPMGQQLALQAAKIGHFANGQKLRMTIVETEHSPRPGQFLAQYSALKDFCEVDVVKVKTGAADAPALVSAIPRRGDGPRELVTHALCWDSQSDEPGSETDVLLRLEADDPTNLSLAGELLKTDRARDARVLVFQTRQDGFGALFPDRGRGAAMLPQVRAFGMLEDLCSLETLFDEREDAIARVLHAEYRSQAAANVGASLNTSALVDWPQLPDSLKDSNRRAADHIRVKLRAVGYRVDDEPQREPPIPSLNAADVLLLAQMEHESWRAEWKLQGYSWGEKKRDDIKKTHPYLVPWDALEQSIQEFDKAQVVAIPEALRRAGYGIYPQVG